MKNKVWIFLLIILCGSAATLSAFAYYPDSIGGSEISNDEMTTDKQNAVEAAEAAQVCETDCLKEETALCNAKHDVTNHLLINACLKKAPDLCEKRCN